MFSQLPLVRHQTYLFHLRSIFFPLDKLHKMEQIPHYQLFHDAFLFCNFVLLHMHYIYSVVYASFRINEIVVVAHFTVNISRLF